MLEESRLKISEALAQLPLNQELLETIRKAPEVSQALLRTTMDLNVLIDRIIPENDKWATLSRGDMIKLRPLIASVEKHSQEFRREFLAHVVLLNRMSKTSIPTDVDAQLFLEASDRLSRVLKGLDIGSAMRAAVTNLASTQSALCRPFSTLMLASQKLGLARFQEDLLLLSQERMRLMLAIFIPHVKWLGIAWFSVTASRSGRVSSSKADLIADANRLLVTELALSSIVNMLRTLLPSMSGANIRTEYICHILGEFLMSWQEDKGVRDELVLAVTRSKSKRSEIREKRVAYRRRQLIAVCELLAAVRLLEMQAP